MRPGLTCECAGEGPDGVVDLSPKEVAQVRNPAGALIDARPWRRPHLRGGDGSWPSAVADRQGSCLGDRQVLGEDVFASDETVVRATCKVAIWFGEGSRACSRHCPL